MLPDVETRPGETVPLSDMPPDPFAIMPPDPDDDRTHTLCPRCFPSPRVGDRVVGLCGYVDHAFPGFASRRPKKIDCRGCLAVIKGLTLPPCAHSWT